MPEYTPERALRPVDHERSDVRVRSMIGLFALILTLLLLMLWLAYWVFPAEIKDNRFTTPFPTFPSPRLQPSPPDDMKAFYHQEMRQLNSAGWQEKAAGAVHIPIHQAMELIAKEGIAGWPASPPPSSPRERR